MSKSGPKVALSASRDIPFNRLVLSQANVRRIKAGIAVEELAEDIARRTLLQSLTVRPVLDDDGTIIADSASILIYIAKKRGLTEWLPSDPDGAAAVQRWLSVAAGQIAFGPAAARLITVFGAGFNAEEVIGRAHAVLKNIDDELATKKWIIGGDHPTIADVALYSYIARAPEGNVDLAAYANVDAWLKNIEALPNFVPFVQTPVGLAAAA